jgi:hypothetical protein
MASSAPVRDLLNLQALKGLAAILEGRAISTRYA